MNIRKKTTAIGMICLSVVSALLFTAIPTSVAAQAAESKYAALGDSIAAGAGLAPAPGATPEDMLCGRSSQAYPQQLATALAMPLTDVACGNAKTSDLYGQQVVNGTSLEPQIDAAFASGKPGLISITTGANDLQWSDFVRKCHAATCGSTTDDAAIAIARLKFQAKLAWALFKIQLASHFHAPKVLVTGYFQPFSDQQCANTQGLTPDEMAWLNMQSDKLSHAIRSVTHWFGFAEFVPVDFSGHQFCAADPWIQGLQNPAPYHPTAAGQAAIAEALRLAATQ